MRTPYILIIVALILFTVSPHVIVWVFAMILFMIAIFMLTRQRP